MTRPRFLLLIVLTAVLVVALCLVGVSLWRTPAAPAALPSPTALARATLPPATATPVPAATVPPSETPVPTLAPPTLTATPDASPTPSDKLVTTLQAIQNATIPERDLYQIAIAFGKIPDDTPRVVSESDPGYQLGDVLTFHVSNLATQQEFDVEATLRAQSEHASWWVANNVEVNQSDLEASVRVFEEQTYPTNRAIFGSEWSPGVDGDPRVHIFLGEVPGVGGYYSSADEFPRTINPNSNEKEIFYLNFNNAQPGNDYFDGILAHEFQHMIHWNMDRNEELWINEGLSELAAQLNGFEVGSGTDAFARDTDIPVTRWPDQSHPFYGSAFLFLNYFYQRFEQEAISALVRHPEDGPQGFDAVLAPYDLTFDELFADWTVANLLNDPNLEEGRFGYRDGAGRTPSLSATVAAYPLVERGEVFQYGTDYLRFEPDRAQGTLVLEWSGDTTAPLLPAEAHSGAWMLWSNRGDDGHTWTQRPFDLTGLERATLRFWTWYDLETDYDYAYLTVSTDGGKHWQVVPTAATTPSNPHGNSFGAAFTGRSGLPADADEAAEAQWIEQTVDLTPFAGQPLLVGFHTITDDALNQNGFVVDDLSIPELGYAESFEEGSGGWQHQGYARVDNELPQSFIVQAVAEGSEGVQVLPVPLDAGNQATLRVAGFGQTVERVTLVVSGATPSTSAKAGYRYAVRVESVP